MHLNKYLLRACFEPATVLDATDTECRNKTDIFPGIFKKNHHKFLSLHWGPWKVMLITAPFHRIYSSAPWIHVGQQNCHKCDSLRSMNSTCALEPWSPYEQAQTSQLEQQFPTFLEPGTSFMEDNFSTDLGGGWFQDDSSVLHSSSPLAVPSVLQAMDWHWTGGWGPLS